MTQILRSSAALAARTPASRQRYLDFLRAFSLLAVVIGHWLLAVVTRAGGGGTSGWWYVGEDGVRAGSLLMIAPATQWLTWLFQVMPLFFLVGGYVNATSWYSARSAGLAYGEWLARRCTRLLRPAAALLACWIPAMALLRLAGLDQELIAVAGVQAAMPLWFLAVYILVIAVAPLTIRLHERAGAGAVVALVAMAAAVDLAHHALGVPWIGWTNFAWVWLTAHQLGYLWRDGTLRRNPWTPCLLALGGLCALALLVGPGPYPLSMVGVDGGGATNNSPPTVALAALAVWQTGAALLAQRRVERWLRRPRVWLGVVMANRVGMTLYLWHLSALILVALVLIMAGRWPEIEVLTAGWWLLRPVWLAALALALIPFVALFARVERRALSASVTAPPNVVRAAAGAVAVALGITLLIQGRLVHAGMPAELPLPEASLFTAGCLLLGALPRVRRPIIWGDAFPV